MKRLAPIFALLFAGAAHAQSGLAPANTVMAGPTSGGQNFPKYRALVPADLPTISPGSLALASGQIMVGQASNFAGAVAMSGDCTIVASGAITCPKANGVTFGALATVTAGTGVAAAAAVNVGSAGAVVVNGGALGTPSSGVGTNITGLPAANLTGTILAAQEPAFTGDVTKPSGSIATTVAKVNGNTPGGTCTAQFVRSVSTSAVPTCASIANADLPTFAKAQTLPANPASTVSTSAVMMGLAGALTPTASGNVQFQARFDMSNSTASTGCVAQLMRGTGAAPANGAVSTGTAIGNPVQLSNNANTAGLLVPSSALGYAAGLTVSTALWYDVSLRAVTGGTCAIFNITLLAIEE